VTTAPGAPGPASAPALVARALGVWATNCAVLGDRARGEAVVVDPGQHGAREVPGLLERLGVRPVAVLLTHGHLDHLWAAPDVARTYDVPVLLHAADRWLWDDPAAAFGPGGSALATQAGFGPWGTAGVEVREVRDGERLDLAGIRLDVHHTPGHTPGHVVYTSDDLVGAPMELDGAALAAGGSVLLAGDLLFAGSIGRTDLPGGYPAAMTRSLAATMARCADTTLVLPGHGPATTVGRERAANPFLPGAGGGA
jgi:hydroxyacylglutathione hydrolase